jgi:transposase
MGGRIIGIQHRIKQSAEGEARPTILSIQQPGVVASHILKLATGMDELDFVLGIYPTVFRDATIEDNLTEFHAHHVKYRRLKKGEDIGKYPENLLRREGGKNWFVAAKVPDKFDGLRPNDAVSMVLGGSGDRFAFALARRAEEIGAKILRVPPFILKGWRDEHYKTNGKEDAEILAEMIQEYPGDFYVIEPRDRNLILVREALRARTDAMKARIACEQRLRQQIIGRVFCESKGLYPEGGIEILYDQEKANDVIYQNLTQEEKRREKDLTAAVEVLEVYQSIFKPIEGCGVMIAARLISAIQDIRRFATDAKLKAFCGVHLIEKEFARKRRGRVANWHNEARQALYLLGDQFNRRPNSVWGQKLLEYKKHFRREHPEKVDKKYSDMHIHRMAIWRTLTKFVEWLHREWRQLEVNRHATTNSGAEIKKAMRNTT